MIYSMSIILIMQIRGIMVKTIYYIVKAHGGELKVEMKEGEGVNLLFF